PHRVRADVDSGIGMPVAGLGVAAARQQPDDDPCRQEDDDGVEENRDEAEWDARMFHRALPLLCSTLTLACGVRELRVARCRPCVYARGDLLGLPGRHARLTDQQVRQIDVVPAL